MWTNIQLVSHGTPDSHSLVINVKNIDSAVNIAYGFGSSPLGDQDEYIESQPSPSHVEVDSHTQVLF